LWKRVNSKAAIVTLFSGLLMAALRIGAELYYSDAITHFKATGEHQASGPAYYFAAINFANMAIFMCLFSVLVCVGVSLMTQAPDYARLKGLSFGTLSAADRKETRDSFSWVDVVLSLVLVLVVLSVLTYFTG
jgi:SSS family solute:Na+ symporter